MILTEMIHDVRIIPLDGRPHLSQRRPTMVRGIRVAAGKATRSLSRPQTSARKIRSEASPARSMRLTERFTRNSDEMIKYTFTVERRDNVDPTLVRRGSLEYKLKGRS